MKRDHDALLAWALTRLERPVEDPGGLLTDVVDGPGSGSTPSPEKGSIVILVEEGEPLPLLSDDIRHACHRARMVLLAVRRRSQSWTLEPHSVLEAASKAGVQAVELRRFEFGWGMILVNGGQGDAWQQLALSEAKSTDELARTLAESRAAIADLQRRLAAILEEQRSVMAEADESRERAAVVERKLKEMARSSRQLEAQLSDLRAYRVEAENELQEARHRLADLPRLRNELERLSAEVSSLNKRRTALEERQRRLIAERTRLRHLLAVERWKRRSMFNRRWWRLGRLLAGIARRPWAVRRHWTALERMFRSVDPEPRPRVESTTHAGNGGATSHPVSTSAPTREAEVALPQREPRRVGDTTELIVAAVLDDMSAASFAPECELVTFKPDNWRSVLESAHPDLLFVESAWKGNSGSWEYQIGSYSHPDSVGLPRLNELVDWCRARGIPTVFWNKEDPLHFEKFKEAARLFDYVFTTDADRVAAYRSLPDSRIKSVATLPFAAQPKLHYPAPLEGRQPEPVFAGTFYRDRHPERREQLELLLDGAMARQLVIYDRMNGEVTETFGYPERFRSAIVGGIPYPEMVETYRRHRVFLNTNSVVNSPTMFSRRVFELLACATPVLSTPSRGISEMFSGAVTVVTTAEEVAKELDHLVYDDRHWLDLSRRGFLSVARRHLYEDRLRQVAQLAGFRLPEHRQVEVVDKGLEGGGRWERSEPSPQYVVFGSDDSLGWAGRIVDADVVGYTDNPRLAYQWSQHVPRGEIGVRRSLLEEGWRPGVELPSDARAFLIPE